MTGVQTCALPISAVIANNEAETLLRVEEFDDAFAFANDLGGHAAAETAAASASAATAAAAAEAITAATAATAEAIAAAAVAAARGATAAGITAASVTAPKSATIAEAGTVCAAEAFITKTVALVPAATTALAFTPSIETHARKTLSCPPYQ